jgi:D-aminopeptidase
MTNDRARARDLGLAPGTLPPGPANAITDVPGIRVGQTTVIEGSDIRTGVTAVVHDALVGADEAGRRTLPAGLAVFNGFGKMVGTTQITELGTIEAPVLLTSTLSVFRVADALLSYLQARPGYADSATLNPVVAETNDGYLSDIWARPITEQHVRAALDGAAAGPVAEGAAPPTPPASRDDDLDQDPSAGNSCVIVIATDARLDSRQLTRLAARAFGGMARAGSDFSGRSGDYALAISTAGSAGGAPASGSPGGGEQPRAADRGGPVPDKDLDLLFLATIEATEEAILNSLFMAVTTTGAGGRTRCAVPLDYVTARVRSRSARRSES